MARCTATKRNGEPCTLPARAGSERCGTHSRLTGLSRRDQRRMLLDTFSHTGVLAPALQAAGICRATHYLWLDQDPDYAQAFREATAEARDTLESEVFRRAVEGTTETHWTKDGESYEVTKYSDNLLMFLTKQRDPSFRDGPRTVVQAGAGFDANGQPYAGVQVSESIEALAENFARWQERHAIDVTSTES